MADASRINLTNQFLIAMPGMAGGTFTGAVVYLCEHTEKGALGLVINKPIDIKLRNLFEKVELKLESDELAEQPVFFGGPVQTERGFVLHSNDTKWQSTLEISSAIYLTASRDIITALAAGRGPKQCLIALGYAGWGEGQLEAEIAANSWLTVPADKDIIFNTPFEERWTTAAQTLGIDVNLISSTAGHA